MSFAESSSHQVGDYLVIIRGLLPHPESRKKGLPTCPPFKPPHRDLTTSWSPLVGPVGLLPASQGQDTANLSQGLLVSESGVQLLEALGNKPMALVGCDRPRRRETQSLAPSWKGDDRDTGSAQHRSPFHAHRGSEGATQRIAIRRSILNRKAWEGRQGGS